MMGKEKGRLICCCEWASLAFCDLCKKGIAIKPDSTMRVAGWKMK